MDAKEFALWRKGLGISQEELAERWAGVSRSTIQNWEAGISAIPPAVADACKIWERRLKQERANLGPVTLIFADAPLFVDAFRPHRLAVVQRVPFLTNAAAIARVRRLWNTEAFYNPFIIEESGLDLWNAAELSRVVAHEDQRAPTMPNLLVRLAKHVRDTSNIYVRSGPRVPTQTEAKERQKRIETLAKKFDVLAEKEKQSPIEYTQVEDVLYKLRKLGKTVPDQYITDIVQALGDTRWP